MNNIRQFEFIIEIAQWGSISKAAKKLKISQPTLSKYLSNLETKLGVQLFDRTTIPIKLTKAGEKYVSAGKQILETYRYLDKEISDIKSDNIIRIGVSPTRARYIIPKIIKAFKEINSSTKVIVKEFNTTQLNTELLRGELDVIISIRNDGTRQFEDVSLFDEKIVLAIPKKFKNLDAMTIIKECPFISIGSGLTISNVLLDILHEAKAQTPVIEAQSIELAMSMAECGLGVCLAPSYIGDYGDYNNLFFLSLPDEINQRFSKSIDRKVCVFYRSKKHLREMDKLFIKVCKDVCYSQQRC